MSVILWKLEGLAWLEHEGHEFKVSLGYISSSSQAWTTLHKEVLISMFSPKDVWAHLLNLNKYTLIHIQLQGESEFYFSLLWSISICWRLLFEKSNQRNRTVPFPAVHTLARKPPYPQINNPPWGVLEGKWGDCEWASVNS